MQVRELLERHHPGMMVLGSAYPPPPWRAGLARAVGLAQMGGFALVGFGERLFEAAGAPVPAWYSENVAANRIGAGLAVWLGGNLVSNQLVSTGAFEVFFDGRLVRLRGAALATTRRECMCGTCARTLSNRACALCRLRRCAHALVCTVPWDGQLDAHRCCPPPPCAPSGVFKAAAGPHADGA